MSRNKILRRLHQLPAVFLWRIAIFFASKSLHWNIVVCDATGTQSKHRDRFAADVRSALDDLAVTSPELLQRTQQYVHYIARAQISNRFEYFSISRLLLLDVDYESGDVDQRSSIRRDIVEAARLIHLANSKKERANIRS
jgi:ABC-type uncharacterized transport system YnjBCD ATPase subunit